MWKRDEAVKPVGPSGPVAGAPVAEAAGAARPSEPKRAAERETANIGQSVLIKGELSGSEDLTIDGQVEGKIELGQNVLTVGPHGKIKAQIFAKAVVVLGQVTGNVTATEKVDIREHGSVEGDIVAPRVAIADGAHFRGSIDMQRAGGPAKAAAAAAAESKAAAAPTPAPGGAPGGSTPVPAAH
jgi:cytoskeletal protein CcmA (bactofilin family)